MKKEALKVLLASGQTKAITIDAADERTISVYVGGDSVAAAMKRDGEAALKKGNAVTWADGTREFINVDADLVEDGDGYVWADDGNRVRCLRTRVTITPDGTRSEKALRPTYRLYENIR